MPAVGGSTRTLRRGDRGPDVLGWQRFLTRQRLLSGRADFVFGPGTEAATIRFQHTCRLSADGRVGPNTARAAVALGYDPVRDGFWPEPPRFPSLHSNQARMALFGRFEYVAAPGRDPDAIRITGGWKKENIVWVDIPQLEHVPGARHGRVQFHRKAAGQLAALFRDWAAAGLQDRFLSFDGSFVPRFQRGCTVLSAHSWGSAFDLNARWNRLDSPPAGLGMRGCVLELVEIANRHGFFWGGHFTSRFDGMHFEVARLLE